MLACGWLRSVCFLEDETTCYFFYWHTCNTCHCLPCSYACCVDFVVHLNMKARLGDAVTGRARRQYKLLFYDDEHGTTVNSELAQINHRITSLKTIEQRLEQDELTKHETPNDTEDDAERSTRTVATSFPLDTTKGQSRDFSRSFLNKSHKRRPYHTRLSDVQHQISKKSLREHTTQPARGRRERQTHAAQVRTSHGKNETSQNNLDTRSATSTAR